MTAAYVQPDVPTWGGEKSLRLLVDLHLSGAGKFIRAYSLFTPPQILRWPWLSRGGEKRGGTGGSPPHKVHGGQPGALLALPKAGNCHDPYPDTVGNGSTLG